MVHYSIVRVRLILELVFFLWKPISVINVCILFITAFYRIVIICLPSKLFFWKLDFNLEQKSKETRSQQGENTGTDSMLRNGDGAEHGDVNESQSGKNIPRCTEEEESISEKSSDSNLSSINDFSSITTGLIRRRAEAEAAKTRIQYAVKEKTLRKQRAEIEAELKILNLKREAIEAECHILESSMRGA